MQRTVRVTVRILGELHATKHRLSLLVFNRKHLSNTGIYHNIEVLPVESRCDVRSSRARSMTVSNLAYRLARVHGIVKFDLGLQCFASNLQAIFM